MRKKPSFFLFPRWELTIPTLGTFYSHVGNFLFPRWELFIPMLGTFYSHVGNNKSYVNLACMLRVC